MIRSRPRRAAATLSALAGTLAASVTGSTCAQTEPTAGTPVEGGHAAAPVEGGHAARVVFERSTGRFRAPTPAELADMQKADARERAARPGQAHARSALAALGPSVSRPVWGKNGIEGWYLGTDRGYSSVAQVLPDGRIAVACGNPDHDHGAHAAGGRHE